MGEEENLGMGKEENGKYFWEWEILGEEENGKSWNGREGKWEIFFWDR